MQAVCFIEKFTKLSDSYLMKTLKFIVPLLFPALLQAEVQSTEEVLPQLSLEAQKARVVEGVAQESNLLGLSPEAISSAQQQLALDVQPARLMLSEAVAKAYLLNNFQPLWQDKNAEQQFLKEYAALALSGVSPKSAEALQTLLSLEEGKARDILLTDSFLDYLYYHKNALANANQWLYANLGGYRPKSPEDLAIQAWVESVKQGNANSHIQSLIPQNHIYHETLAKIFASSAHDQLAVAEKSGKKTKNSEKKTSISLQKLALNAQRLRLIPSFDNGIFVNIPSYQLYYFRDGALKLQSKVIVGRDDRRTPVMYSKLSNVVVNPPWNVPASIKNKDLVPKMRKDPGYVERHGYEIIDSKGRKVSPYDIAWEAYGSASNFPYHLRQKAGDDSALGRYKFNMPSSDAIFLHDTPNHSLFNKANRALSSGCVRVAKSDALATILLQEAGWTEQRKKNVLASKKTTSAQIQSDNPVYLYYVTAWVENGQVHTLPDIYKYDTKLPNAALDWEMVKQRLAQ